MQLTLVVEVAHIHLRSSFLSLHIIYITNYPFFFSSFLIIFFACFRFISDLYLTQNHTLFCTTEFLEISPPKTAEFIVENQTVSISRLRIRSLASGGEEHAPSLLPQEASIDQSIVAQSHLGENKNKNHSTKQRCRISRPSFFFPMTDVSISLPAKRKRGRPRKDNHLYREGATTSTNSPKHPTQDLDKISQNAPVVDDTLVGSTVHGVIDGSFDAGYLISVRIGNNETAFRGVVFQPRRFVPITSANDVAPQAKMYQRREINNDINITGAFSPQPENPVFRPVLPPLSATTTTTPSYPTSNNNNTHSNFLHSNKQQQPPFLHSTGNLRMVEEDEVMQAFEVSTSSKAMSKNIQESLFKGGNEMINKVGPNLEQLHHHNFMEDMPRCAFEIQRDEMVCPENYHQNLLTNHHHHHQTQNPDKLFLTSDHLKLDLCKSSLHEKKPEQLQLVETNYLGLNGLKSPNLGYQQALVAGNPLLLPPAFIGEPALDFMLGKTTSKSPTNSRTNLEVESSGGAGAGAPYDLELATPQSNVNARTVNANQTNSSAACINDMDFDLSDVVQPTESHGRQNYLSETEHR